MGDEATGNSRLRGVTNPFNLEPMPAGRAMETLDERTVRASVSATFDLVKDVESWPALLSHYRYVRFRSRNSDGGGIAEFKQTAPREFSVAYEWNVGKPVTGDWRVFVHFTDPGSDGADRIKFQNDHAPRTPLAQWKPGTLREGPFTVKVPDGLHGTFAVRMGLFQSPGGERALLPVGDRGNRSCVVGKLTVAGDKIEFEPGEPTLPVESAGDPALFTRADNGWAEGLHVLDRFVKNTHEILSPLNEITARMPMMQHEFLTPDRTVQRSVFGSGSAATEVVVNASASEFRHKTKSGGTVILPPFGFVVESPTFVAFCATEWNGQRYAAPALFTLRALDAKPLAASKEIRVCHAFGDDRLNLNGTVRRIPREETIRP